MHFTKLVPNIFYSDINKGITTFVDCLGFTMTHDELNADTPFCVLEKDGLQVYLFQDSKYAEEHSPEFRLVTNNIEEVYNTVSSTHPELLHPNLNKVTVRPWRAKEFAIMDNQIGIVFQEWPK